MDALVVVQSTRARLNWYVTVIPGIVCDWDRLLDTLLDRVSVLIVGTGWT